MQVQHNAGPIRASRTRFGQDGCRRSTVPVLVGVPFAVRRRFRRGDFLAESECPAETFHLVRRGYVREFRLEEDGRETTMAVLGPGQLVGLAPLLGHAVHRQFAEAVTGVEAWAISVARVRERLAGDSALLGLVVGSLAQRVGLMLGLLSDVAFLPVAERLSNAEHRLGACLGDAAPALKRTTLAALIHARPETVTRVRATESPVTERAGRRPLELGAGLRREFVRPGEVIPADLPSGRIGLVVRGEAQVLLAGPGDRSILVDTLGPEDVFGLGALFGLPPVGLRLRALSEVAIQVLRREELLSRLADHPRALEHLRSQLGSRLELLEWRLARMGTAASTERLLDLLRELAAQHGAADPAGGRVLPCGWSHEGLAHELGLCRETVTRGLAALEDAGEIRRHGRRIVVIGEPAQEAAEPRLARERSLPVKAELEPASHPTLHRRHAQSTRPVATTASGRSSGRARRDRCHLCGLGLGAAGPVCTGCADRLELELRLDTRNQCPFCSRHRELCRIVPCGAAGPVPPHCAERTALVWVPVEVIDEPRAEHNSRRRYSDRSIEQLAASIREHGLLQPLCVRRMGSRYRVVFGVRRLRAAVRAGMSEVPCTVQAADDDQAFLLNVLENLHREQLSGSERVQAVERLAATRLGVREISRRTGFDPSTISRWLRIGGCPELKAGLEAGHLDISRAKVLVEAPRDAIAQLVQQAPSLPLPELRARVASLKLAHVRARSTAEDQRRLRQALRCLRAVRSSDDPEIIDELRHEIQRLGSAAEAQVA
jgi:ParB/RepB/Spo0J family partition protein